MTGPPRRPTGTLRLVGDRVAGDDAGVAGGRLAEVVYLRRCYGPAGPHGPLRHWLAKLGLLLADVRHWLAKLGWLLADVRLWLAEPGWLAAEVPRWCGPGVPVRRWLAQAGRLATNVLGGPVKWLG